MSKVRFVDTWLGSILGAKISIGIEDFRLVVNVSIVIDAP
jgi:hypothetical protein